MRLGKILFLIWLWALAMGAQAVAAPSKSGAAYDEVVSAASFEYWDQDSQLLYLRARWYDPRIGRFISADPRQGKQQNPRSLNRYVYADNNSVSGSDPSGEMTLGEIGSGLNTVATMAVRALNAYDSITSMFFGGDEDSLPLDGKQTLFDVLMAGAIKAVAGSMPSLGDPYELVSFAAPAVLVAVGGHGHHVIPVYMCGAMDQELVMMPSVPHGILHAELLAFKTAIDVAGTAYTVVGRRRKVGATHPPLYRVARTSNGRIAIAGGLGVFYQTNGVGGKMWADMGKGEKSGKKLIDVLFGEMFPFAAKNHSWPSCKR